MGYWYSTQHPKPKNDKVNYQQTLPFRKKVKNTHTCYKLDVGVYALAVSELYNTCASRESIQCYDYLFPSNLVTHNAPEKTTNKKTHENNLKETREIDTNTPTLLPLVP